MKNKQEEKMVLLIIKYKQDQLCYKNNSIELNLFIQKIIKSNKLWRCISKCINGNKLLKLLKNHIMLKFNNSKLTIIHGSQIQDNKKKLHKLNKKKVIMLLPFNCILKEVSQPELPMQSIILMSVILKIYLKKLQEVLHQQECLKKQVNFINKLKNFKKHQIFM